MFFCEFCEISSDTFLTEHLRTTASERNGSNWFEREVFEVNNLFEVFQIIFFLSGFQIIHIVLPIEKIIKSSTFIFQTFRLKFKSRSLRF